MTNHNISSDFNTTYEIKTTGDNWTFTKSFSVFGDKFGIDIASQYTGNTIVINGEVHGNTVGVNSEGNNTTINLGSTAKLTGFTGLGVAGDTVSIVNDSKLAATTYGVFAHDATHVTFTNNNSVKAEAALVLGPDSTVINSAGATITGTTYGVAIADVGGSHTSLVNHGTITSAQDAYFTEDGNTTATNDGTIIGTILLGAGNDRFDNRGGVITNAGHGVTGNEGNDTLITDSAKVKLIEEFDQGTDTVKATVSYKLSANVENLFLLGSNNTHATGTDADNVIHGNSGDNVILGLLGADDLYGHKGNDNLTGGGDADVFHFSSGDSQDIVTDFENGLDKVDVSGWKAITSFDDLMQHHVAFKNGDAIITAGHDSLTLDGVAKADLDAGDFTFAI